MTIEEINELLRGTDWCIEIDTDGLYVLFCDTSRMERMKNLDLKQIIEKIVRHERNFGILQGRQETQATLRRVIGL